MSKAAIAVCLLAFIVVAANAQNMDCGGMNQAKDNCCQLCNCLGQKNAELAKQQSACKALCSTCANQCAGKTGPLPKTCQDGMNAVKGVQSALQQCLSEYQAARAKGQSALEAAMKNYQAGC